MTDQNQQASEAVEPRSESMQGDLYECANRKCRHHYKHKEAVMVRREMKPWMKELPSYTGTCPKCGCSSFYMANRRKK